MLRRAVRAVGCGTAVLLSSAVARAQCTKDIDCKADRVCEAGKCTWPAPTGNAPSSASGEGAATPADAAPPETGAPAGAGHDDAPTGAPDSASPAAGRSLDTAPDPGFQEGPALATQSLGQDEPRTRRRNRGLMVGGIVMASVGPLALLGALSARNSQKTCDEALEHRYPNGTLPESERARVERCDSYTTPLYVLGIGGAALIAAGVPMIIYGAKSVPAPRSPQARVMPWATPSSGGVQLRVDL